MSLGSGPRCCRQRSATVVIALQAGLVAQEYRHGQVPVWECFAKCRIMLTTLTVESSLVTAEPTFVTAPRITSNLPAPTTPAPTVATPESPLVLDALIRFNDPPVGLQGPFETPNLIIPVDKSNPSKTIGNGYVAELSATVSTIFVFDVRPEHEGKTCNLDFHMPPISPWPDMFPVKVRSPGGINVASVGSQAASDGISANDVGISSLVGSVPSVEPANQYSIASVPCAAGQRVAYQLESTGGLVMDFFQMIVPPLGLFMSVT